MTRPVFVELALAVAGALHEPTPPAFSRAVANGVNQSISIVLRSTLEVLTAFGDGGRQPGQFFAVHSIATDSKGNLFTTETYEGRRLQKFVYKGLGPVSKPDQGPPWPRASSN